MPDTTKQSIYNKNTENTPTITTTIKRGTKRKERSKVKHYTCKDDGTGRRNAGRACSFDLAPRKPCELARRREKVIRRRNQFVTFLFFARKKASLFTQLSVMDPQLPLLEMTSGMKELCSISRIRSA